jgi:hypothetical protein
MLIAQHRDELLAHGPDGVAIKDWEWTDVNLVAGVRKPREPRGRDRYFKGDERERLLAA